MMEASQQQRLHRVISPRERVADAVIHALGISAAVIGAAVLLILSALRGSGATMVATAIYAAGFLTMLSCSAAYHLTPPGRQKEVLRRLDHAGIFLMIAGTYTPFTTQHLAGSWAITMTSVVWSVAVIGIIGKLVLPRLLDRVSIALYLGLGWLIIAAIEPLLASMARDTLALLLTGGMLYTVGVVFHLRERLPFQTAVWHSFVLAAATVHYFAVLDGVVLL